MKLTEYTIRNCIFLNFKFCHLSHWFLKKKWNILQIGSFYTKLKLSHFVGPPSSRPSQLVQKIIERIRSQERLRRQATGLSLASNLTNSPATRGKRGKLGFAKIVNQAMDAQNAGADGTGLKGARAFRAAVNSVLSPANREFMDEQARRADRRKLEQRRKRLVIGGKTFSVDEDDLSVLDEDSTKGTFQISIKVAWLRPIISLFELLFSMCAISKLQLSKHFPIPFR